MKIHVYYNETNVLLYFEEKEQTWVIVVFHWDPGTAIAAAFDSGVLFLL